MTEFVTFKDGVLTLCDDTDDYDASDLLHELNLIIDEQRYQYELRANPYHEGFADGVYKVMSLIKERLNDK